VLLAEARYKQADAEVKRNESLVKSGATPKADFEKMVADRDVASAQIASFKATVDAQQLNVDFCQVRAPINGRVSRAYVTVGNLVAADQSMLTTIVAQNPMYVYFDIDERTMLNIQDRIRTGKFKSARQNKDVVVRIGLATEPGRFPHEATVDLVDNKVDSGTGTLKVRAVLQNPVVKNEERLFSAGLFVRVQVPMGEPTQSLLVSERALGTDQGQKFLLVVNKIDGKNMVEYRPVATGPLQKGGLRVVSSLKLIRGKDGLRLAKEDEFSKAEESITGSDWVIVNGLQRVRPGMEVRTNEVPMPSQLPLLEAKEIKPADSK
jgi:RND family efflux transporter MFP subunit